MPEEYRWSAPQVPGPSTNVAQAYARFARDYRDGTHFCNMTPAEWDHVIEVNLNGAFYISRAALPHMVEQGYGRIINISSVIGETGNIGQANYAAAKSGLFGLTMSLALESAGKGITVNCVAPGFVETEMVAAVPEEILTRIVEQIPLRRLGRPDEVARVVAFLADPASSYITGQIFSINGGLNM